MKIKLTKQEPDSCFNMTPMIDVVFLLITFFILASRYVAPENFETLLPQNILSAAKTNQVAVTVNIALQNGVVCYAVGTDVLDGRDSALLEKMICSAIDSQVEGGRSIVCLRCDKRIAFEKVRPVISGIALSRAEKVEWAVLQ